MNRKDGVYLLGAGGQCACEARHARTGNWFMDMC